MEKPGVRSDLVNTIKGKLQNGETLMLFGDQFITPSFGDDLVRAAHSFCIEKPQSELFHVCGPDWFTPFQLGHAIAEELEIENPDIIQTSLDSFLETDPRPRQKCLRMDTRKYQQYCPSKGIPEPMGLREVLRNSLKQGDVSA
jgi:dTDP-4-dehydrorhamnose reductase